MGDLQRKAEAIRDERGVGRNTSGRVGEVLVEVSKEVETLKQWKGFNLCGSYDAEREYKKYDLMEYEGASYVALKNFKGITPSGDNIVTQCIVRRGDKGESFIYSDFTPEQLAALRGEKGDAFTFGDFTAEQLAALKGEDGKDFAYEDFTPEQLATLKGADGKDGLKGDKGDPGKGLSILGYYGTLDLLKAAITAPEPGDAYGIGTAAPYDIYVFDGRMNKWVNNGKLSGGGGEGGGNVVLIPFAVLSLTKTSTSEEILNVFGGKEAFIDVVTRVKDGATVTIKQGNGNGDGVLIYTLVNFNAYIVPEQGVCQFGFTFINSLPDRKGNVVYIFLLQNDVIQLVEKEVTPLGYANIVSIPPDVMSLSNESTSDEIKTAFGGKPAFEAIIEKVRVGKAVGIISDVDVSSLVSQISLGECVDSDNCALSFNTIGAGAVFIVNIEVVNGVFSCDSNIHPLLLGSSLVSDPSVGGTYKPASAEAVKIVNDKAVSSLDVKTIVLLSQSAYDGLATKDEKTLYIIHD